MWALWCGVEVGEWFFREEDAVLGGGQDRDVFGCVLMRALAGGTAGLPCALHLKEVT